jgi:hypothetical protein
VPIHDGAVAARRRRPPQEALLPPSGGFDDRPGFKAPGDLRADRRGVTLHRGQPGVGTRFEARDLGLARVHSTGQFDLGQTETAPLFSQLPEELATPEGGRDPVTKASVVYGQLVDDGVEIVLGHDRHDNSNMS